MKAQIGDPPRGQVLQALIVALAIFFTTNVVVVSGDSPSPLPPYVYMSPPPPFPSPPPPYKYVSPPPSEKSPPPPYVYKSPPPPYDYASPPPPKMYPPPYYYASPPPPKMYPPPYYYVSPPPPKESPPSPYYYKSPPPPYDYKSPPPPYYYEPIVKVVGKVYCYECYDWNKTTVDSHVKKLFEGAIVKVTCMAGSKAYVAYGETKSYGKYSVVVEDFPYSKYGAEACEVELHAAPKGSTCNIPTELNKGAKLKVESMSYKEVVLMAKPLAFAPEKPSEEECSKLTPPYHYYSPPPPSESPWPPYYYKSPPPPYMYKSPPPPPYIYKSPPPPMNPPPPYHY